LVWRLSDLVKCTVQIQNDLAARLVVSVTNWGNMCSSSKIVYPAIHSIIQ